MRQLKFENPTFGMGLNYSIRLGRKVFYLYEEIELTDLDGVPVDKAVVVDAFYIKFSKLADEIIFMEHDPACRDRDGIKAAMKKYYTDFTEDSEVTVVGFVSSQEWKHSGGATIGED